MKLKNYKTRLILVSSLLNNCHLNKLRLILIYTFIAMSLKHVSNHAFGEFGVLGSEEHLSFDNYYHKTKALSMNGPNDRILEHELEMDGIVSANSNRHPYWYTKGRKWNCGK